MISVAKQSANDGIVIAATEMALGTSPINASAREKVAAIYQWIQSNVRFVQDNEALQELFGLNESQADLIIAPARLLTMPKPSGDCDCFSTLLASMLLAADENIGVYFVTTASDATQPKHFSHVYVMAELPCGEIVPLDASHGSYPGWETNEIYRKQIFAVRKGNMICDGMGALPEWLTSGITTGIQTTSEILSARYGVPPPGTSIKTPTETVVRQATYPGFQVGTYPSMDFSTGAGDVVKWLLIGGGLLVGLQVLKGK